MDGGNNPGLVRFDVREVKEGKKTFSGSSLDLRIGLSIGMRK